MLAYKHVNIYMCVYVCMYVLSTSASAYASEIITLSQTQTRKHMST